jgi:hypothetical protein
VIIEGKKELATNRWEWTATLKEWRDMALTMDTGR